jgi:hypothetical protein
VDGVFRQTNLTNESSEYLGKREELRLAEIEFMRQRERVAELRRHLPQGGRRQPVSQNTSKPKQSTCRNRCCPNVDPVAESERYLNCFPNVQGSCRKRPERRNVSVEEVSLSYYRDADGSVRFQNSSRRIPECAFLGFVRVK